MLTMMGRKLRHWWDCHYSVAILSPPRSPYQALADWSLEQQALADWSLEQQALAKLCLHCWPLTDWPSASTSLDHLPLAKWPLDRSLCLLSCPFHCSRNTP
ncbi:unnamed protein product [Boreogadus saida]